VKLINAFEVGNISLLRVYVILYCVLLNVWRVVVALYVVLRVACAH
jgi:hypothetical protein